MAGRDDFERHAIETPFDSDNDPSFEFPKENVQEVIEELCNRLAVSANPGFTWGKAEKLRIKLGCLMTQFLPINREEPLL